MSVATIRVADLAQATRALEQARAEGVEARLVSAAEVTAFAGVGYWHALELALGHPIVIDCGDDAGPGHGGTAGGLPRSPVHRAARRSRSSSTGWRRHMARGCGAGWTMLEPGGWHP